MFTAAAAALPGGPDRIALAATVDADDDGLEDLLVAGADGMLQLFSNVGDGSFAPSTRWALPTVPAPRDLIGGDCDDDGDLDLVVSSEAGTVLVRQAEDGFAPPLQFAGASTRVVFGDADHDGDVDALVLGVTAKRLYLNDGAGTFTDRSDSAGVSPPPASEAIFTDYDNDRDVDFVTVPAGSGGAIELFTNNRDGTFADIAGNLGMQVSGVTDLAAGDFDADSYIDFIAMAADGAPTLLANQRGSAFAVRALGIRSAAHEGARAADVDNDGDLDLVLYGSGGWRILSHVDGEFVADDAAAAASDAVDQLLVRDVDADGRVDLLVSERATGGLRLHRNETAGGHYIGLRLSGLNSNPNGFGTKVEVKTTYQQQKLELRGGSRDAGTLTFGLAEADSVEFIRILWPSGVRQTELATGGGQRLALTELNRKGTSCPILYAWDGTEFRFVSDFLGGAIIGYPVAPGEYSTPDTDEYLPLGPIAPLEGKYTLQVANQLEEIVYLDAATLVAVDHPPGLSVLPDERLLSAPPYPDFGLFAVEALHRPQRAVDDQGRDVTQALLEVDDVWYDDFALTRIHGYAEPHSLEIDMGDLSAVTSPVLIVHGWVDYAHSTSNWAAFQQDLQLSPPSLEVGDGDGGWRLVTADMGTPAGLPKYMTFDLEGHFTPGDYRLRISTSAAIYWDQIAIGAARPTPDLLRVHRRRFEAADLHWRGYPEHTAINGTFAFRYHYDRLNPYTEWGTHRGAFTRFGEVAELLEAADDRYVIMFHGDELTMEVREDEFPPRGPGMERTFLLYADGFGKDMDYHSAHSLTVGPLPFHGMSSYPYPETEAYPTSESHVAYQLEYNTRRVRGYYE